MLERLEKALKEFHPPFLPTGFVKTRRVDDIYGEPALNIRIGDRDATVLESGEITGAGTNVGDAIEWEIKQKKD